MCLLRLYHLLSPLKLHENGCIIHSKDVIEEVRADHGINILYSKAWRTKEYAQNFIYRDPLHSFLLLPSYFYMLKKENLRIVTKLKIDEENRFEYLFMTLGLCINGFQSCNKPVIMVDGTHLKGKFQGVMFVAATNDVNK